MTELETLLEQGAGHDPVTFDAEAIGRSVTRRRIYRRVASGCASLVLAAVVAAAVIMVIDREHEQQVATEPTPGEPVDVRAELSRGGWVAVEHSDWAPPTEGLGPNGPTTVRFHEAGRVEGQLLCNEFGSTWQVDGAELVLGSEMSLTLAGCDPHEKRIMELLGGRPTIEWSEERPDELRLRDGDGYIDFERIDPWFTVLTVREAIAPIGSLDVARDRQEVEELLRRNARLTEDEQQVGPGFRPVDFEQSVVVSIVIPNNACPPTLERLEREGSVLTPVFVQPPGACRDPLFPKVFFVAIDRADVVPGFTFRYPAEDPLLQHQPSLGAHDGEIWVEVESAAAE